MLKLKNLQYLDKLNLPDCLKAEVIGYASNKCNGDCRQALMQLLKLGVITWEQS